MKGKRAFTLIEVMVCLAVLAVLFFPLMEMVQRVNFAYSSSIRLANLRSDVDRVGYRVQGLLRRAPAYRIASGNRGAILSPGKELAWRDQALSLSENGKARELARNVTHFSLFRRDGLTTLSIELRDPVIDRVERRSFLVEEEGYATRI